MPFESASKVNSSSTFTSASDVLVNKYHQEEAKGLEGVGVGIAKSLLKLVKGAGQVGTMIGNAVLPKSMEIPDTWSDKAMEANKNNPNAPKAEQIQAKLFNKENLKANGTAEKVGNVAGDVGQFVLAAPEEAVTKGLTLIPKIAVRAASSAGVAALQAEDGSRGKDAAIAAGTEAAIPIVGKYVAKPISTLVGRVVKGLASGLSGVGTDVIDQIVKNPKLAKTASQALDAGGNTEMLRKNADTFLQGVSTIRQQARQAYGDALDTLKNTDIDPTKFRSKVQPLLDKFGSVVEGDTRTLNNVEFSDPSNIKKASAIIDKIQNVELDGKSLKKLTDFIESKKYKIATSDERLSFNSFINDISTGLKKTINESTDKLGEMNANYSKDMQLTDAIEKTFGKVKFKSAAELNKISQNLESLFSKKGLTPQYVDDFLNRLGLNPEDLKTSEAVRQISDKASGANTKGLNVGEMLQQVTSGIVTPKTVRNLSIATGIAEDTLHKVLRSPNKFVRESFVKTMTDLLGQPQE